MKNNYAPVEGDYEFLKPSQRDIDNRITGLVFRCAQILIWIEVIYEKLG